MSLTCKVCQRKNKVVLFNIFLLFFQEKNSLQVESKMGRGKRRQYVPLLLNNKSNMHMRENVIH
jgi:hypothetical protein